MAIFHFLINPALEILKSHSRVDLLIHEEYWWCENAKIECGGSCFQYQIQIAGFSEAQSFFIFSVHKFYL